MVSDFRNGSDIGSDRGGSFNFVRTIVNLSYGGGVIGGSRAVIGCNSAVIVIIQVMMVYILVRLEVIIVFCVLKRLLNLGLLLFLVKMLRIFDLVILKLRLNLSLIVEIRNILRRFEILMRRMSVLLAEVWRWEVQRLWWLISILEMAGLGLNGTLILFRARNVIMRNV